MDYPSETNLCTVAPSPADTTSSIFSEGRGRLYIGYLKRIIWTNKLIVHSKLKPFHFQIKTYYLSDKNYQTYNPSHTNSPWKRNENGHFCYRWMSRPGLELVSDKNLIRIIKRITHLTQIVRENEMKTAISVIDECRTPTLSWAFGCLLLLFPKDFF